MSMPPGLSKLALITGLVQALGTTWGLFQHYWVLIKLLLTAVSTLMLFSHTPPVSFTAGVVLATPLAPDDLRALRIDFIFEAAAAIPVLLVITVLSVFKPRGLTPYGRRKVGEQRGAPQAQRHDGLLPAPTVSEREAGSCQQQGEQGEGDEGAKVAVHRGASWRGDTVACSSAARAGTHTRRTASG